MDFQFDEDAWGKMILKKEIMLDYYTSQQFVKHSANKYFTGLLHKKPLLQRRNKKPCLSFGSVEWLVTVIWSDETITDLL